MSDLHTFDGMDVHANTRDVADFIIVGSGPGGATAARVLSEAGFRLIMIEEGSEVKDENLRADEWSSFREYWRAQSLQLAIGRSFWPILQGCEVGGPTPIHGALIHRIPYAICRQWRA